MELRDKAMEIFLTQEGKHEDPIGSNKGPEVNEYLKSVGLPPGYPWCASILYWSYKNAAKAIGVENPLLKTGSVMAQWAHCKDKYAIKTPEPGAIFIMRFKGGTGHTGIVLSVDGDNIHTIEGNASDHSGTREGYIVTKKTRPISSMYGFLKV